MEDPKYVMDTTPAEHVVHLDEDGTTLKLENDELPEGATLVLNSDDVDQPTETAPGAGTLSPDKFMSILRTMLASEKITHQQAMELRRRFGITGSYFTKPKVDAAKKKRRKQMAKISKRRNRYNGSTKGQKREGTKA